MNKATRLFIAIILIVTFTAISITVYADSPEVLQNPSFEDDIDYWQAQVVAEMIAVDYWEGITPQVGNVFMLVTERYSYSDTPLQLIKEPLNFYGKGDYRVRGYIRLAPSSSLSSTQAQIVVRLVSSDKTSGSPSYPGVSWLTSGYVSINKTSWTLIEAVIAINWSANLEAAEFYFMTHSNDAATDLCFDGASMVKVGYEGPAYAPPTPTPSPSPVPATPTVPPTPTTPPTATVPPTPTTPPTPTIPPASSSSSSTAFSPTPVAFSEAESASEGTPDSMITSQEQSEEVSEQPSGEESMEISDPSEDITSEETSSSMNDEEPEKGKLSIQAILGIVILVLVVAGAVIFFLNKKSADSIDDKE
jgi:hypothetical protein